MESIATMERTASSTTLDLCRQQRNHLENARKALADLPPMDRSVKQEKSEELTHRGGDSAEVSQLRAKIEELEKQLGDAKTAAKGGSLDPLSKVRAKQLYENFKEKTAKGVDKVKFGNIMKGMGLEVDDDSISSLFEQLDSNKDGLVRLEEWLAFADEMPFLDMGDPEPMDRLASTESQHNNTSDSRFVFEPKTANPLAMFVDTTKFDAGVEGLIGRADPNTRAAIKAEHCLSEDSMDTFQTINNGIMTTSFKEYWIVAGQGGNDEDAPDPLPVPDPAEEVPRAIKSLDELLATDLCKEANLVWEEVLALRLYSGPMYMKYNALLREMPQEMIDKLKGNMYTTTIHLIVSGILKLSKVQKIPRDRLVYRGLGGRRLPRMFYLKDANGCRGGVEAGFMSTTTSKEIALQYSGNAQLPPHLQNRNNIIFEIELGKMSMGADISEISQYPHENEILFTPLTHLEIVGKPWHDDIVHNGKPTKVFAVRLRATTNQKSLTLDQLLLERKTMLQDLGRKLVNQCHQLIGSAAQQGKSFVLEVTGDTSMIPMTDLMRYASKEQEDNLKKHIEAEVNSVQATAFNDLVIYQDTMRRLFDVFIGACWNTAEKFASEVEPEKLQADASALGVMIVRCIASTHLMERIPETEIVLSKLSEMKLALIELLEFQWDTNQEGGSFKVQRPNYQYVVASRGERSVRSLLATAKLDYGRLLHKLSKYPEAKKIFLDVIVARTDMSGPESFGTLEAQECLGLVMHENRDLNEAMDTFEKIHKIRLQNKPNDTEKDKKWTLGVAEALRNMGRVHFRLSTKAEKEHHLEKAILLYNESLNIRREAQTEEVAKKDMIIAKLEEHLGSAYAHKGEHEKALGHFEESLKITKQVLGPENVSVADIFNLMGKPHLDRGEPDEALKLYDQSIKIKTRILGKNHASLARSWNNLASVYEKQGNDLASVHEKQEKYDRVFECLEEALRINEAVYTHSSPHCVAVIEKMIETRKREGQEHEVLKLTTRLLGVRRRSFNPTVPGSEGEMDLDHSDDSETDRMFEHEGSFKAVQMEESKEVVEQWTEERFKIGFDLCKNLLDAGDLDVKLHEAEGTQEEKVKSSLNRRAHYDEASGHVESMRAGILSLEGSLEKLKLEGMTKKIVEIEIRIQDLKEVHGESDCLSQT